MALPDPDLRVSVLYTRKLPAHYVARLGRSGWFEGWGWTLEESLADLTRHVLELAPAPVLSRIGTDQATVHSWLVDQAPTPLLDE
jgi:hypothetical protein